jgi:hypothetical protein
VTLGASLLTILGGSLGLFAAVAALTGDALGRVNLLFSLVLFALLPALLLLLTLALLLLGRRRGILHGLLQLQLLPRQLTEALITQPNSSARRAILFFLSQVFAFAFAAGSLAGFGILLLATDVSFVWRSTLLQASDLYPLLSLIGSPWGFWPEAQASLAMLDITQDFRLAPLPSEADYVGQWWRYLLDTLRNRTHAQRDTALVPTIDLKNRLDELTSTERLALAKLLQGLAKQRIGDDSAEILLPLLKDESKT